MVGRVINLLGVHIGDDDHLMPPNPYNPRGHWENMEVLRINDAVLEAMGGAWDDPPELLGDWEVDRSLDALRDEAAKVMAEQFGAPGLQGWKDPRASLTLPFWRTVTEVSSTIMCVRSPREVAASLAHRDDIDPERAAHLWLRYTASGWHNDPERLVVRYDELHDDTADVVHRIADHIGCPPPSEEVLRAVSEFIDPALHHHDEPEVPRGPMMDASLMIWELLARTTDAEADLAAHRARRSVRLADSLGWMRRPR